MSDPEFIGDIAQGALAARAVEPAHGEGRAAGNAQEGVCLNCGTGLIGSHCHQCGQAAHVHKTLGAFFHDFLHGVFHFEGKIWRTLPALVFRPGRMTRDYIDGRRATYVSPIALFLFAVFLMFAVVKQFGPTLGDSAAVDVDGRRVQDPAGELLKEAGVKPKNGKSGVYSDAPLINEMLTAARENPQLALYQLQSNAYKFAWLLIPISVPFVWLLFAFKRRFGLYDHTVFVTYSLCFMTLLVSVLTIGSKLGVPMLAAGMVFIPPVHIYKQVRYTYALTRWGALWRTAAMGLYAFFALTMFLMAVLALSAE